MMALCDPIGHSRQSIQLLKFLLPPLHICNLQSHDHCLTMLARIQCCQQVPTLSQLYSSLYCLWICLRIFSLHHRTSYTPLIFLFLFSLMLIDPSSSFFCILLLISSPSHIFTVLKCKRTSLLVTVFSIAWPAQPLPFPGVPFSLSPLGCASILLHFS